jgi:hypothetical protein
MVLARTTLLGRQPIHMRLKMRSVSVASSTWKLSRPRRVGQFDGAGDECVLGGLGQLVVLDGGAAAEDDVIGH